MTIAKINNRRAIPACVIGLSLFLGLGSSLVMPEAAQACGRVIIARKASKSSETIAQTANSSSPRKKASYNTWQGTYEFFETASGDAGVKTRFYRVSMLQLRCGWQAQVRVSGDDTPHTSVGVNVRSIGDDEIGLYYNGDKYDGRDRGQFEPGQLLLRIRLENDDTHRIFFEGISPLVEKNRDRGLAVDPPTRTP